MTDYERYDRLRAALSATAATPKAPAHGVAKEGWHHQEAALSMANDWTETHDLPALAQLDAAGRAEQRDARETLHHYVDAIWEAPKWRGEAPTASPAYDVVAALRDLFADLVANADQAISEAGDPDPDDD
jgi:hypothetical protein